ncbi:unnamed protein product [Penicillium palitans]
MRPIVSALVYCMGLLSQYGSLVYARLRPSMEKLLSAAIAYLMVLKSEVSFLFRLKGITNHMISHGTFCTSGSEMTKMTKSWQ